MSTAGHCNAEEDHTLILQKSEFPLLQQPLPFYIYLPFYSTRVDGWIHQQGV